MCIVLIQESFGKLILISDLSASSFSSYSNTENLPDLSVIVKNKDWISNVARSVQPFRSLFENNKPNYPNE